VKAGYEHLSTDGKSSVRFFIREEPRFEFYWHYHPEIELTCILKGEGTRLVADHTGDYTENDLVLIGPNVPHSWQSRGGTGKSAVNHRAVVAQFSAQALSENLLGLPEMETVNQLLGESGGGIRFTGLSAIRGREKMMELAGGSPLDKLLGLFDLLDYLARTGEWIRLGSEGYRPGLNRRTEQRLDRVLYYMHTAWHNEIRLGDLAHIAAMNESAFSRFFQAHTGKPPITYLNEVRVRQACQMLVRTSDPVSLIARHCGFNNQAHFNRIFRRYNHCTPGQYRKTRTRTV
jgi:AraC-like DNA-binding protein